MQSTNLNVQTPMLLCIMGIFCKTTPKPWSDKMGYLSDYNKQDIIFNCFELLCSAVLQIRRANIRRANNEPWSDKMGYLSDYNKQDIIFVLSFSVQQCSR